MKQIISKDLLSGIGMSTHSYIINSMGKESEKDWTDTYV